MRITFKVNRKPHPDIRHLESRIFTYGRIAEYTDNNIVIDTVEKNEQWIKEYVMEYCKERNVEVELI